MPTTLIPFDMASLLDTDEAVDEHLSQVFAEGDTDELIRVVVCSQGSGPGAKPRFHTVVKVMRAMGVKLHAQAVHA